VNWQVNICIGSGIHPEDAARAVFARFVQSRKRRDHKRISEERIWEDLFIATSLAKRPWNQEQIKQIEKSSRDRNFRERLTRANADGKRPIFDSFDILFLRNWRELHLLRPEIQAKIEEQEGKLPGFQDWSPKAVTAFLEWGGIKVPSENEEWFVRRRQRLGLPGKYRYKIKDFIVIKDSVRIVR
jgi:hypothetical protein